MSTGNTICEIWDKIVGSFVSEVDQFTKRILGYRILLVLVLSGVSRQDRQ